MPTVNAAPPIIAQSSLFRIIVHSVHAHANDNGYRLQLCVGLRGIIGATLGSKKFIPMTLWDAQWGVAPAPPWWDADAMSIIVQPSTPIHWGEKGHSCIIDYLEIATSHARRLYVDTQLRKVAIASDDGGELRNATALHSEQIVMSNDTETTTHQLLAFDGTVSMTIELKCMSNDEAVVLRADLDQPVSEEITHITTKPMSLAESAAAINTRASKSLRGSRAHQLLSAWGGALEAGGGQMAPMLSALPFGKLIIEAAAGLFSAVMGPDAVVELGADVCGQTALLLHVLIQPLVRELIKAKVSTHSLLERLLGAIDDTVKILDEFCGSPARLWNASSRLALLQEQSNDMHNIFTLLHQLMSFHAQTTHVGDTHKILQVVGSTQLLTADSLTEVFLPQLVASVENVVATIDATGATTTGELLGHLLQDITIMTTDLLEAQFSMLQSTTRDSVRDEMLSVVSAVAMSGSDATLSVLSQSMRSLIDNIVHNVLPSMIKSAVSSGLKEQLEDVVGGAWLSALQQEIRTACAQVQAHTPHPVSVALIQLGSHTQSLQQRLDDASAAAAAVVKRLERTMRVSVELQIAAKEIVRDEAVNVRTAIENTHHSLGGKIAVLHVEVSGLLGELHLQRRVLEDIRVKLDSMYEVSGATLKKQTDITEVLDVLPESVCKAFSRDVQRLHQHLQRCGSQSKADVRFIVDNAVGRIVATYNEHQALQRRHQKRTKRYISLLQTQLQQSQLSDQNVRHAHHRELMDRRFNQLERMINMLQANRHVHAFRTNCLLYDPFEDDGHHLTVDQRRYYADYPLQLLQVELRKVYHELDAMETSVMGHSIKLSRMRMYTSLRIVHVPTAMTHRETAAESYEGALMESTEVLSAMKSKGWRSLLVEGRAGIGKTTWAIHLAQLQNFADGVVILLKLSEIAKHLEMMHSRDPGLKLSPRELLFISFGATQSNAALVELVFYKIRHCDKYSNTIV